MPRITNRTVVTLIIVLTLLTLLFFIKFYFNNIDNNRIVYLYENALRWERILKKRCSTILGGNSSLPIIRLIYTKKIQNLYTEIQWVKSVKTFNFKCATEDAFLISKERRFHSPAILFIKLNLNKLVVEWRVKSSEYPHSSMHTPCQHPYTEDASLISRERRFHSPTILFIKMN